MQGALERRQVPVCSPSKSRFWPTKATINGTSGPQSWTGWSTDVRLFASLPLDALGRETAEMIQFPACRKDGEQGRSRPYSGGWRAAPESA